MAEAAAVDRPLPHNLEAERSVLGAVLIHNDAFNPAAEVLTPRDFYRDAHRRIFEKMIELSERGNAIDFVTLREELSRSGELDEVGRPGLRRGARRRTAARDQRRVLRAHRPREIDAPQSHLLGQQDPRDRVRGGARSEPDSRRGGAVDLRDCGRSRARRLCVDAAARARQLRGDRAGARAQAAHHRRAVGVHRPRRADGRLPAGRSRHHRGAPVGGKDGARAEHRAARRHQDRDGRSASSASRCRRSSCSCGC